MFECISSDLQPQGFLWGYATSPCSIAMFYAAIFILRICGTCVRFGRSDGG